VRRTRILVTLGPATSTPEAIASLIAAGTDAFRLNFSHGTSDDHARMCRLIRDAATAVHRPIAVLQDLSGPKIRIGALAAPILLRRGDALAIELGDGLGEPGRVTTTFDALFRSVRAGHRLLLDDGRIELEVTGAGPRRLDTQVITGGVLEGRKGINVPNATLRTPALTSKDLDDLRAGIAMGVDLVAQSFVQSADDVRAAKAAAAAAGAPDLPVIAKIEKPQAVEQIDDILAVADGLMVARGDLGIELPLETLPVVQDRLILAARKRGVPVIVATQVLESMRTAPRPTRAEVTDAAHAVGEGADAIMLAGETAVGQYPIESVAMLDAVIRHAESVPGWTPSVTPEGLVWSEHGRALCEAAVALADRARAAAIVAVTEAGKTARMLAALRPAAQILAATPNAATAARLALVWGVTPMVIENAALATVRQALRADAALPDGAIVVYVSMHPVLGGDDANFLHVGRT
jgi:pyruvate kinase